MDIPSTVTVINVNIADIIGLLIVGGFLASIVWLINHESRNR